MLLSGKAWVFCYITRSIFPTLFGEITVQRNRLGLTDEDPSEYRTFDANTKSDKNYQHSKAMLCTFHAIWKPFKETIRPRLPKKSCGVLLSNLGKSYGEFLRTCFVTQDVLHFMSTVHHYCVTCRFHNHGVDYAYMHRT